MRFWVSALRTSPSWEIPDDGGFLQADGDDMALGDDDAQGEGGVHHRVVFLHGGHVDDQKGLSLLCVDTGSLLLIQSRPEEGGLHAQA